jgi:GNAT superfamily N-acetyltransferase
MIHLFEGADLARISHLQPDGWEDITEFFEVYVEAGFCLPLKIEDNNRIVALGSLVLHRETAWLAHIIVDARMRRKGLGLAVTEELIRLAEKNGRNVQLLIATQLGAPLYECAGFRHSCDYVFYQKQTGGVGGVPSQIRVLEPGDFPQLLKLDRLASGEDRSAVLSSHGTTGWVYTGSGGKAIRGFFLPNLGEGTIVAQDAEAGTALMGLRLAKAETAPVLPAGNRAANSFLRDSGLKIKRSATRMVRNGDDPLKQDMVFNRIGGHLG